MWHPSGVPEHERAKAITKGGATIWVTGLSGSGKSTLGMAVESALVKAKRAAFVIDGDNVRHGLNADLGFSSDDRKENVRRVGEVAALMAHAGIVVIVTLISPFTADRDRARKIHEEQGLAFFEVFVDTPLEECIRRDSKGLYSKALSGELPGFTGIDAPYERPSAPDLRTGPHDSLEVATQAVIDILPVHPPNGH